MLFPEAPSTSTDKVISLQFIFHLVMGDVNYWLTVLQRKNISLKNPFLWSHILGLGSRATFFVANTHRGCVVLQKYLHNVILSLWMNKITFFSEEKKCV